MLNLLVTIDRSLEASFALRTACLFGMEVNIIPIYVFDPPGRDISFGAGWARKSWERETNRMAEENVEGLVMAERNQCPNIDDPVVLTGEPFHELAEYFWAGNFDLLVVGSPFRGMGPLALCKRFGTAAHKGGKSLPLMVVRQLKNIGNIMALTDGSDLAENTLGLLMKINSLISGSVILVGIATSTSNDTSSEVLNLERGLAILNEQGVQATAYSASELGPDRLSEMLREADLLVNPIHQKDPRHFLHDLNEDDIQAVLLQLDGH